jgi:hypothetical protein
MRVEFLPPYSPDLNPIELSFSIIKQRLKREERTLMALSKLPDDSPVYSHLFRTVYSITSEEAQSFFRHCQYM